MACIEGDCPVQGHLLAEGNPGLGGCSQTGERDGHREELELGPAILSKTEPEHQPLATLGMTKSCPASSSAQPATFACPSQNCQGLGPCGKLSRLRSSAGFGLSPSRRAGGTCHSSPSLLGPWRAVTAAGPSKSVFPMIWKGRQMGT